MIFDGLQPIVAIIREQIAGSNEHQPLENSHPLEWPSMVGSVSSASSRSTVCHCLSSGNSHMNFSLSSVIKSLEITDQFISLSDVHCFFNFLDLKWFLYNIQDWLFLQAFYLKSLQHLQLHYFGDQAS